MPTVEAVQQLGSRVIGLEFDVADGAQVQDAVARATAELGPIDILVNNAGIVNNIAPIAQMPRDAIATPLVLSMPEDLRTRVVRQVPAGRLGQPAEIAAVVAFLASPAAAFVNGAGVTPISGAQLAALTNGKIDPTALKGAQGFAVNNVSGLTAALSGITLQHADNVVINTTPGVDIQQLVNMTLTIQNFGQIRDTLRAGALAGRIARIGQVDPVLSGMH